MSRNNGKFDKGYSSEDSEERKSKKKQELNIRKLRKEKNNRG